MDKIPFTQRFVGAVLVAVVGGLTVHALTDDSFSATLRRLLLSSSETDLVEQPPNGTDPGDVTPEPPRLTHDEEAQRRTVGEVRLIGTGMMAWLTDEIAAAAAGGPTLHTVSSDSYPLISYSDLYKILVPFYLESLPRVDGWGHEYEFRLNVADPLSNEVMAVRSPGRDGEFSGDDYRYGAFEPTAFDEDIVWTDGYYVQWPNIPEVGKGH